MFPWYFVYNDAFRKLKCLITLYCDTHIQVFDSFGSLPKLLIDMKIIILYMILIPIKIIFYLSKFCFFMAIFQIFYN